MRILLPIFLICSVPGALLRAQSPPSAVQDAFLISRMAEKFHIEPRPLDQTLSSGIYIQLLDALDGQHIFFTKEDIAKLSPYQYRLDEEIRNRQSGFLGLLISLYKERLGQADSILDRIAGIPFSFSIREKLTVAEDSSYPADRAGMYTRMYKLLKSSVLTSLLEEDPDKKPSKKYIDSLEPILRKRAVVRTKRTIKRILQSPMGIDNMIGAIYCQELASCYDPHTAYFQPDMKTAFESRLGNTPLSFGLSLNQDDDGNTQIGHLQPGGPAFQSGAINEGDKIQSIQWDDKDPIDVSSASMEEISQILSATGGNRATFTLKKADGTTRQVVLRKARLDTGDDEDKVKGFILKGAHTMGYISLPAFYSDWEDSKGVNGCANDVAKEIIKMKKENIEGLILDLRYNGGGSMEEAIELSGIFIDAGPVAQVKSRDPKIVTLKDMNRGTIYDGPLMLLVNGLSASASEMVAGTLQDYNRALIVGSPTYGKATAQVVLPMDTTIDMSLYNGHSEAASYIKITVNRLYRITGASAQFTGVQPDIVLPDPAGSAHQREADEKFALRPNTIERNKYYIPYPPLPVAAIAAAAKKEIDSSSFFKEALADEAADKKAVPKDVSLFLDDAWQEKKQKQEELAKETGEDAADISAADSLAAAGKNGLFIVTNHAFEQRRLAADHDLKEINEERKTDLLNDPYIQMAYRLMTLMIRRP
jgi:carboxyl-terminal processing protease